MSELRSITVEYYINADQEERIKSLADKHGMTVERFFNMIMTAGSWHVINPKIEMWENSEIM